eukprot:COSAG03_NODE_632_length_6618_cov_41.348366_2_plen_119_part_00
MFHQVAAHCAGGSYCGSDATLCGGAPVFQRAGGGAVLYRYTTSGGYTQWYVGPSERLGDCEAPLTTALDAGSSLYSRSQPSHLPPDVAGYGWSDPGGYDYGQGAIHIVAGGGGGGGGR